MIPLSPSWHHLRALPWFFLVNTVTEQQGEALGEGGRVQAHIRAYPVYLPTGLLSPGFQVEEANRGLKMLFLPN